VTFVEQPKATYLEECEENGFTKSTQELLYVLKNDLAPYRVVAFLLIAVLPDT